MHRCEPRPPSLSLSLCRCRISFNVNHGNGHTNRGFDPRRDAIIETRSSESERLALIKEPTKGQGRKLDYPVERRLS